ncbi:hypothetical protein GGI07_005111 [Coemansia sp. Benny D115]|nr:hypothetical protein GGI07_005111 [Coemansia sp. Benny D115]
MFTNPILDQQDFESAIDAPERIIFHSTIELEIGGYRSLRSITKQITDHLDTSQRFIYNIVALDADVELKDYSDFKTPVKFQRGILFYKKNQLMLEMKNFNFKEFLECLEKFDKQQPEKATMFFTKPILTGGQMEKAAKAKEAIIFFSTWRVEQGYRNIKARTAPLVEHLVLKNRFIFNIVDLHESESLIKDFSDFKHKVEVKRGVAFYKNGELLLQMPAFDLKKFIEFLEKFDKMSNTKKETPGCCAGCTIL